MRSCTVKENHIGSVVCNIFRLYTHHIEILLLYYKDLKYLIHIPIWQACVNVASTYDTDDVAEAWNSCIRMSCLKHGATVHTRFDIVSPYPMFEPRISLKVLGTVLINTGNYFHALSFDIEDLSKTGGVKGNMTVGAATPGFHTNQCNKYIWIMEWKRSSGFRRIFSVAFLPFT